MVVHKWVKDVKGKNRLLKDLKKVHERFIELKNEKRRILYQLKQLDRREY